MEDDSPTPPTQPFGALVPPSRFPPTAVAAAPAPGPRNSPQPRRSRSTGNPFHDFVIRAFDAVDAFADTVAEGLGLRRR